MKNKIKFLRFIAVMAIVFSMAACGDNGDPNDLNDPNNPNLLDGSWTVVEGNFSALLNNGSFTIDYCNGKFIAGGAYGSMAYSTDGIAWTPVADSKFSKTTNVSDQENVQNIAWGNGKFVAVTAPRANIAYSPDCVTWTAVASSTFGGGILSGISAIAYGSDKFVAVGNMGKMAASPDGVTWTAVTNNTFGTTPIRAIVYGDGKFVAGSSGSVYGSNKMAYSSDGVNWTAVSDSTFGENDTNAIAYGNGKFVAVGYNGRIAYSSDGSTWTAAAVNPFYYPYTANDSEWEVEDASAADIRALAFGNGNFVAVSFSGKTAVSLDGSTWTVVSDIVFEGEYYYNAIKAIAFGGNKFVVLNGHGQFAYFE